MLNFLYIHFLDFYPIPGFSTSNADDVRLEAFDEVFLKASDACLLRLPEEYFVTSVSVVSKYGCVNFNVTIQGLNQMQVMSSSKFGCYSAYTYLNEKYFNNSFVFTGMYSNFVNVKTYIDVYIQSVTAYTVTFKKPGWFKH